jgi:hypothetical protein
VQAVESREGRRPFVEEDTPIIVKEGALLLAETYNENSQDHVTLKTPIRDHSPDPSLLRAPLGPANDARIHLPALVSGHDEPTPTPGTPAPLTMLSATTTSSI